MCVHGSHTDGRNATARISFDTTPGLAACRRSTTPQYLYRIRPTRFGMLTDGPTEREAKIVDEHFAYLKGLVAEGTVLLAGRTLNMDERTFGVVIFVGVRGQGR